MILPLLERLEAGELDEHAEEAAAELAAVMRALTLKAGGRDGDLSSWCERIDGRSWTEGDVILSPRGAGELLRVAYERGRHDERRTSLLRERAAR